jgi:hypothetical protein
MSGGQIAADLKIVLGVRGQVEVADKQGPVEEPYQQGGGEDGQGLTVAHTSRHS